MSVCWDSISAFYDRLLTPIGWHQQQLRITPGISGRVLEACCGTATLTHHLLQRRIDTYAIDLAPKMVRRARARLAASGLDPNRVMLADVSQLPFPDRQFDYVLATGALGLLPAPLKRAALREMVRVCRGEIRLLEPFARRRGVTFWWMLTFMVDGMKPIPLSMMNELALPYQVEWHTILGIFSYIRIRVCVNS